MATTAETSEQWYDKTWLVIVLYIFFFPVGLYALWKSSKFAKGWKILGTVIIALFIITAVTDKDVANPDSKSLEASVAVDSKLLDKNHANKEEKFLFEKTNDFKNSFNKYCSSNSLDFSIEDLDVQEGEVQNTFQYMFTDHLGIIGTVNKSDGSVKEVTMLGTGDGTFKSGGDIILCMYAIIASVDPKMEPDKRTDILKDLGFLGENNVDLKNLSSKTEQNGIKYFVSSSSVTGLMFGASRK